MGRESRRGEKRMGGEGRGRRGGRREGRESRGIEGPFHGS